MRVPALLYLPIVYSLAGQSVKRILGAWGMDVKTRILNAHRKAVEEAEQEFRREARFVPRIKPAPTEVHHYHHYEGQPATTARQGQDPQLIPSPEEKTPKGEKNQYWREIIKQAEANGEPTRYLKDRGIPRSTFYEWKKKLCQKVPEKPGHNPGTEPDTFPLH